MKCTNPLLALRIYKPIVGKQIIKILPRRIDQSISYLYEKYGEENVLQLPCGHCSACLSRQAKEWSVRCALEARDHKQNCFVTLTYDNKNYPGEPSKVHLQDFIKAIRNHGFKVRYYGCAEQGQLGRWHYHLVLFGFYPDDTKFYSKSQSGVNQFSSKLLNKCWNKGLVLVEDFSPFAAQYVAGYVVKKLADDNKKAFHIQSTRPGIGASYFLRKIEDIYDTDNLILSFGDHKFSIPRYCDKLAESLDLDLTEVKNKRLEKARVQMNKDLKNHRFDSQDKLLVYNQSIASSHTIKKRSL